MGGHVGTGVVRKRGRARRPWPREGSFVVVVSFGWISAGCGSARIASDASQADASIDPSPADGGPIDSGSDASPEGPALPATVAVDTSTTVSSFVPILLFGAMSGYFISSTDSLATQAKVQAAGSYFIGYPGGSSSDDYHWNGAGAYDAATGVWAPDDTEYQPGFQGVETYRGTTSASYSYWSNLTDGDPSSTWLSNVDTDSPDHQWAYVDLGAPATVDSIAIVWGVPYASSFQVQGWSGSNYAAPYQSPESGWVDIANGPLAGTGGTQTVTFTPTTTEYVRVLMTESSAGPGGPYSVAEITLYDGSSQLSTNAPDVSQSNATVSSTSPASTPATTAYTNFDFESFMSYANSFSPPAIPLISVNMGTGSAQEAAAWVHYANQIRHYGIKYWEIGNELDGAWETGGPLNIQDYLRRYSEYYTAMKTEDPSIIVEGPATGAPTDDSEISDGNTFLQDFIQLAHARGIDGQVDAISFHFFPNWDVSDPATLLASTGELGPLAGELTGWISGTSIPPGVPILMSSYNMVLGEQTPVADDEIVNGLWTANWLAEFTRTFGGDGGAILWNMLSSWTTLDSTNPTVGDLGYLQHNANAYRYQEHANYWAMQMMAQNWSIPGDARSHALVSAQSSQSLLSIYADRRPDGILGLLLVNVDPTNAYDAQVDVSHFVPHGNAAGWVFGPSNYRWETDAQPYHATPDLAPTSFELDASGPDFLVNCPPYSITVLQIPGTD